MSNVDYDSDMSWDDAAAALSAAAQEEDSGGTVEQAPAAPAPTETDTEVKRTPEQPVEPVAQDDADSEPVFFNPDDLPEELLPGWKQLQAAFTQKTQALAEERRQFAQFGDPEEVQNAVELYTRLSDPSNWPQLHQEITEALMEAGYEFEDAQQMASDEMQFQADELGVDPDLAPLQGQLGNLEQRLAQQQAYLDQMNAEREYQLEQQRAAQEHQRYVAYMQEQVAGIRQAYPHYTDTDMEAIVQLGSFFNDDLSAAQAQYETIVTDRLNRWIEAKKAAPSSTPKAKNVISEQPAPEYEDIRSMEEDMVDLFRQMQANGEIDF